MYVTDTFWSTLCHLFGQSHYSNSVIMLRKWQTFEGGNAEWNPLNTTEDWPEATLYNSAGVKNYRSQEDGVNATAATLRNGHYPSIVWALENNVPIDSWKLHPIPAEIDTWGTHSFAAYLRTMPPTPIPQPPQPKEIDDMRIVRVPNGSAYLMGSDLQWVPISDGPTETLWIDSGVPVTDLSAGTPGNVLMYQRLVAAQRASVVEDEPTPAPAPAPPTG
jgi:hypothetical protein